MASQSREQHLSDDEKLRKDRERFYAQAQESGFELPGCSGRSLPTKGSHDQEHTSQDKLRPKKSMDEVYACCAQEIVALSKCVDTSGPLWYFKCNGEYIDVQRCYQNNKTWGKSDKSLTEQVTVWADNVKSSTIMGLERWQWFFQDLMNGNDRDRPE